VLETGDILVGRYEVDSLLGRGGMSSVFSGWDRTLGREVAIKVLASDLVEDRVFVERFEREARAAASLSHRNVVAVFDSGVDAGARFIVMERVSGRTLASRLRDGPLSIEQSVEIAVSVSQALGAAHAGGIVHRDVKPGNVMLGENGQVKVLDFGIARALAATSLTRASTVIGTAGYLSPEQAEGGPVDARSDLYGLGCLLYEMLTGRPPFVADSAAALVHQHLTRPPEPPSRRRPGVSPALDEIVLRCLAKDPGARYAGAGALAAALAKAPARTVGTRTGPATTVLTAPLRERRWIAALAAGALVGALLILFALYHGTAGRPGGAPARASAAVPPRAAGSAPKRSATTASRPSAATSTSGASPGQAAQQASTTADPAAAAAALSALTLADQRQGLIDSRAADVISRRTAALLDALASRDPNQAARQLSQFGRRVDALAATGDIATPATAGALKAAAAAAAGALSAPASPTSSQLDAGGEAPPPAEAGKKRGHRHDGPAGESKD
jgi:serine/threonine-protein kinase